MFSWYRETSRPERLTFWTCLGGWALDALDIQMFGLIIPAIVALWHVSNAEAGLVGGITLATSAFGGWLGGALSDRIGRVRALQFTVLWFSLATFVAAFTQTFGQFLAVKAIQGFGFGAEWACGAVLMAEIIRPEHRGRALGAVQSGWAIGWGAAVLLYTAAFSLFPPDLAWRVMFGVAMLPALLILYVRRSIPEPARPARTGEQPSFLATLLGVFAPETLRVTLIGGLFGLGAHGGFYGLFTWLPTYLKTERGLSVMSTGAYLAVIIVAFGIGCVVAGQLLDLLGRRLSVALFAVGCIFVTILYLLLPIGPTAMLLLGFPLGFCAAGIPASMGALFNELYPAGVRGTGVGFCYNFGRVLAAGLPILIGAMSGVMSLGTAIGIDAAVAYSLVLIALFLLPETRGRRLDVAPPSELPRMGAAAAH
jgi:MFS family permease